MSLPVDVFDKALTESYRLAREHAGLPKSKAERFAEVATRAADRSGASSLPWFTR